MMRDGGWGGSEAALVRVSGWVVGGLWEVDTIEGWREDETTRGDEGEERLSGQLSARLSPGVVSCKTNSPFSGGSNPDLSPHRHHPHPLSLSSSHPSHPPFTYTHTHKLRGDLAGGKEEKEEDDNLCGEQIPVWEPVSVCHYLNCPSGNVMFFMPMQLLSVIDRTHTWDRKSALHKRLRRGFTSRSFHVESHISTITLSWQRHLAPYSAHFLFKCIILSLGSGCCLCGSIVPKAQFPNCQLLYSQWALYL